MKSASPLLALALLGAACGAPSTAVAPAPPAPAPSAVDALRAAVLASSEALATVQSLTDEAGPRLSGSPGNKAGIAWALRALGSAGFAKVHAEACAVPHWERGDEQGAIVAPSPQPLALAALGGSVGTPPEGIEAEVIEAASLAALDKLDPAQVAGKIVFIYVKMERTRDGSGYGAAVAPRGQGRYCRRRSSAPPACSSARSAPTTTARRTPARCATTTRSPGSPPPRWPRRTPTCSTASSRGACASACGSSSGRDRCPTPRAPTSSATFEGSAAPGEIVLLGAHLDSWDLGRGAIDDGAGCAIVMEAGRQIARLAHHPRRTVRVVLFANEENGLRGAKAYAVAHAAELGAHVLALEADLGAGRVYEARFLGAPAFMPAFRAVAAAVEPLGSTTSGEDAHGGADLIPLMAAGVPVLDSTAGRDDLLRLPPHRQRHAGAGAQRGHRSGGRRLRRGGLRGGRRARRFRAHPRGEAQARLRDHSPFHEHPAGSLGASSPRENPVRRLRGSST